MYLLKNSRINSGVLLLFHPFSIFDPSIHNIRDHKGENQSGKRKIYPMRSREQSISEYILLKHDDDKDVKNIE